MKEIKIGNRKVGDGHPPLVVAEVGINHEGDVDKAFKLVDAAVDVQAECIKFQCHITDKEMIPTDMKPGKISDERLWDIIKRCELTEEEELSIQHYCKDRGIIFLSTPFSREAADRLNAMNVPAFKIGSGECNNIPLLQHIAKMGKPIILSTGMNDLESVKISVAAIREYQCPVILMHCTSMYPTPYDKVRLGAIRQLREVFKLPVGLSDHSMGIYTCLGAVALGACVLEKHFTITRNWPGPDVSLSIEPDELADLVAGAKAIYKAMGGHKTVLPEEKPVIDFAYASVVTLSSIKTGELFSLDNIWVKRPGTGSILASDLHRVLGKRALRDLAADSQVSPEVVENW